MTNPANNDTADKLQAAEALYEDYLELTRTTIAPKDDGSDRQEFFVPPPAPLDFSLTWSNHALMERPDK